jgi:hypothetical protein
MNISSDSKLKVLEDALWQSGFMKKKYIGSCSRPLAGEKTAKGLLKQTPEEAIQSVVRQLLQNMRRPARRTRSSAKSHHFDCSAF